GPQLVGNGERLEFGLGADRRDKHVDFPWRVPVHLRLKIEEHPLQPGGETHAGHGWGADGLGEGVVPAATPQDRLCAAGLVRQEFPHRPGVVIESAHQSRIDLKRSVERPETLYETVPVKPAGVTQSIKDAWRRVEYRLTAGHLAVEHSQRIALDTLSALPAQFIL